MLIFQNGTAYFNTADSIADIDEKGLPVQGSNYDLSIPCYIEAQSENKQGLYDEGVYPNGSFVVSFDYDSISDDFSPTKVRLQHQRKGDLGEFTIQRIEYYDLTRTIQIWI